MVGVSLKLSSKTLVSLEGRRCSLTRSNRIGIAAVSHEASHVNLSSSIFIRSRGREGCVTLLRGTYTNERERPSEDD